VTINARGHGELLAPSIEACLAAAAVRPEDLGAAVVGLGPGPFTGLRVGLVTAAVFAETLDIPAYGVCSLDAIAAAAPDEGDLLVATDARRKEVYWACYDRERARVLGPEVSRPAEVPTAGIRTMAGAGARLYRADLRLPLLDCDYPRVAGLAQLAVDRIRAGAPAEALTPLYLRRPDAVANATSKRVTR
jgi:tRNA threonylcarbamoyl adenosine modification protein YeaZ